MKACRFTSIVLASVLVTVTLLSCGPSASTVVRVTGVSVSPATLSLAFPGEPAFITAAVTPPDASDRGITWSTSDAAVATVDSNGLVTPRAFGAAVITATSSDGGKTADCPMIVSVMSDFNASADGWIKFAGGDAGSSLSWNSTGGNPGGSARFSDAATSLVDYFDAPAKYLGNKSAAYGGTLRFDLFSQYAAEASTEDVIMDGNGLTIVLVLSPRPLTGAFSSYSLPLVETGGWVLQGTSTAPTGTQMQGVLAGLTGLRIMADWHTGPEIDYLDNVALDPKLP